MSPSDFTSRVICSACPLEMEGRVDGERWFFHARGTTWRLGIAPTHEGAILASDGSGPGFFRTGEARDPRDAGNRHYAGYMEPAVALALVARCVAGYRAGEA